MSWSSMARAASMPRAASLEAARVGDDQFVAGVDRLETGLHGLAGDDHEGEFGAADEAGLGAACPLQELGRGDAEQPVNLEVVVTGLAVAGVLAGEGAVEVHGDVLELLLAGDGVEAVLQFGGAHGEEVDVLAGQVGDRRLALGGVDEVRHDHRPAGLLGEGAGTVHEALVEATIVGVAGAGDATNGIAGSTVGSTAPEGDSGVRAGSIAQAESRR